MISTSMLIPFFAGLLILLLRREGENLKNKRDAGIAIVATIASFISSIAMYRRFFSNYGEQQLTESFWSSGGTGVNVIFAVDGISLPLFLTTTFLFMIAALFSLNVFRLAKEQPATNAKLFWAMLLILESVVLGLFSAYNFVVFFIFWELFLIPVVILIWHFGLAGRQKAALQFFLYTFISSAFMIAAFAAIVYYAPRIGTDFDFRSSFAQQMHVIKPETQLVMFLFFMFAFLVKMPALGFHAWLPLTHTQAPIGTLLLSGLFLKLGSYATLRLVTPNFHSVLMQLGSVFMWLGILSMVYGAFAAYRQKSFRYVIAYSSLAHMGLILAGTMSPHEGAIAGAIVQNIGHSLANALLFIVVGMHLARNKSDELTEINPPKSFMYWFAFSIALFSAIGVPSTVGFVGEFLILFGISFKSWPMLFIAILTLVMSATYMLRLFHKVRARAVDASWAPTMLERLCMAMLVVTILFFGLFPGWLTEAAHTTAKVITSPVNLGGGHQ